MLKPFRIKGSEVSEEGEEIAIATSGKVPVWFSLK